MISKRKEREIQKIFDDAIKYYEKRFNMTREIVKPKLLILSRKESRKLWGKGLPNWIYMFANPKGTVIIDYIPKERLKGNYLKVGIYHELCHAFYHAYVRNSYPNWINEGLAEFLADYKFKDKFFLKFISDYKKDFPKQDYIKKAIKYYGRLSSRAWKDKNRTRELYACSFLAVKKIIAKKGLKYLFKWLKKWKKNPKRQFYGRKIKQLLKDIE